MLRGKEARCALGLVFAQSGEAENTKKVPEAFAQIICLFVWGQEGLCVRRLVVCSLLSLRLTLPCRPGRQLFQTPARTVIVPLRLTLKMCRVFSHSFERTQAGCDCAAGGWGDWLCVCLCVRVAFLFPPGCLEVLLDL